MYLNGMINYYLSWKNVFFNIKKKQIHDGLRNQTKSNSNEINDYDFSFKNAYDGRGSKKGSNSLA
jgi:hypothetical protein